MTPAAGRAADPEIAAALAESAPFDSLPPAAINALAAASRIADYADGELILDAFLRTPHDVYVVIAGAVDLWVEADRPHGPDSKADAADGRAGPGAVFGFDATVTGKAIGPLAVAAGPVRTVRVPAARVGAAFAAGAAPGPSRPEAPDAEPEPGEAPRYVTVGDLVVTEPLMVPATMSVAEAARAMNARTGPGLAALELADGTLGVVTDRLLRQRVLAAGLPASTAVAEAATTNLPRVMSDASAAEALILLLDTQADYVLVMDRNDGLRGVVEPRDFMVSGTTSGVSLHEQIRRAGSVEELQERALAVPERLADMLSGGLASARVLTVFSAIVDSVVRRMLVLVFDRHPDLSVDAFTWLSVGSNGRREATLSSDIDSAAAFHGTVSQDEIDRYRPVFLEVTEALVAAGFSTDSHGATAAHKIFARTNENWRAAARDWLADPTRNNAAMMTSLMVDARPIHGDPGLPDVSKVFSDLRAHRGTMRLLLQESLSHRARLRSLRGLLSGKGDAFDIKSDALLPIVNMARWAALSVGSAALPTTERLRAAGGSSMLPERQAATLIEVFEVLQRIRLHHQLQQLEIGEKPGDVLDLDRISAIDRSIITRAVREISTVQKRMGNMSQYAPPEEWSLREP